MHISVICICKHELFSAAVSQKLKGCVGINHDIRRIGNGAIDHIQLVCSLSPLPVPEHALCSGLFFTLRN